MDEDILYIVREGLLLTILSCSPIVLAAWLANVCAAAAQTLFNLHNPALAHAPRVAAVTITATFVASVFAERIRQYLVQILDLLPGLM